MVFKIELIFLENISWTRVSNISFQCFTAYLGLLIHSTNEHYLSFNLIFHWSVSLKAWFKVHQQIVQNMQQDGSINEEQEQQVSEIIFKEETCTSMVKRKTKYFLTNITLEPVMLFYGIIRSIDKVAQSQLIIGHTFCIISDLSSNL